MNNYNTKRTFSYTYITIFDSKINKYIMRTEYDKFVFFKENSEGNIAAYGSDKVTLGNDTYDNANTLLTNFITNTYIYEFKERYFSLEGETFKVDITIKDNTNTFPVIFEKSCLYFTINVKMTYLGQTFTYVNPNNYLAGAEVTFINSLSRIEMDRVTAGAAMTKFTVITGQVIDRTRTYSYLDYRPFKPGVYDLHVSYRGEEIIIKDFLKLTK